MDGLSVRLCRFPMFCMWACPLINREHILLCCPIYNQVTSEHIRPTNEETALFKKVISLHPKFQNLLEAIVNDEDLMTSFITNVRICCCYLTQCVTYHV